MQFAQKLLAQMDAELENAHKRLDDVLNQVWRMEVGETMGLGEAKKRQTMQVDQLEEGL